MIPGWQVLAFLAAQTAGGITLALLERGHPWMRPFFAAGFTTMFGWFTVTAILHNRALLSALFTAVTIWSFAELRRDLRTRRGRRRTAGYRTDHREGAGR